MKLSAIITREGPKFYMDGTEVKTLLEAVERAQGAGFLLQVRLVKHTKSSGLWRHAGRLKALFVKGCAPQ